MHLLRPGTALALGAAVTAAVLSGASIASAAGPGAPGAPGGPGAPGAGPGRPGALRAAALSAERTGVAAAAAAVRVRPHERLVVKDVITDPDGSSHVRYERRFRGLRVVGGDLVVHRTRTGAVRDVSWNASGRAAVASVAPRLSVATAGKAGRASLNLTRTASAGELVVYAGAGQPRLAYDVVTTGVRADQTPSRVHTIVDATTGRRLARWDDVQTGTGQSLYSGTTPFATTLDAGTGRYQMRDSTRGGSTTTDMNQGTSGTGTVFVDGDDLWGNGAVTSRQSAGVDAAYGAQVTWDYFRAAFDRTGVFNDGEGTRSRVHYGNSYENAFWDGTQMTYGDGRDNARPLVSIDVAAHEMSHGVTQATAGLLYTGEAGGLNEATSDILATAVEFSARNASDVGDYLIGEKIDIRGNGTPLRYLDRPSRDGLSPDCYSATIGSLDPHFSSGPLNHWYYLAAEGSGAKVVNGVSYNSPTCNATTVTGIGREAVTRIWYRTLTTYLTSTSGYRVARDGALRAARDLYGSGSTQCAAVAAAFAAVNVTGAEVCSSPPPSGGQLLVNPGFERGNTGWTASSGVIGTWPGQPARSGTSNAWLDGVGSARRHTVSQTVTIPAAATSATLSFWLHVDTAETTSTRAYDRLTVRLGGSTLAAYSNLSAAGGYQERVLDVTALAGQTVTLTFTGTEDGALQTSFVLDDVSLTAS